MSASALLERLEGVKPRGEGTWIARCPSHQDKTPSLSIRETPEGVTLLHCFAGCPAIAIIQSVGLEATDLFPPKAESPHTVPKRRPQPPWGDVIRALRYQLAVVCIAAGDIGAGRTLSQVDRAAVQRAAGFIHEVLDRMD